MINNDNHIRINEVKLKNNNKRNDIKNKTKLFLYGITLIFIIFGYICIRNIKDIQNNWNNSLLVYKQNNDNTNINKYNNNNDIYYAHIDNRKLIDDDTSYFPDDAMTEKGQRQTGAIFHLFGMFYMFVAIGIVCDEYFVPAIEVIVDRLDMQEDTAGATWMAAGGSAPELFTSILGTFVAQSQVGFGTIVGSAVFNVLFVVGCCALAVQPNDIPLTYWPFARDSLYYTFCLTILAIFFGAGYDRPKGSDINQIQWWESLILLLLYVVYAGFMPFNQRVYMWFERTVLGKSEDEIVDEAKQGVLQKATINFHVKLFTYLTKDKTFEELAQLHVVQAIKGTLKETFEQIDTDRNGTIDREEFKKALERIEGVAPTKCDELFDQVDKDRNGQVDFKEFESWYLTSETKLQNDIRNIFRKFDRNRDGQVYTSSIKELLKLLNANIEPSDDEVSEAMKYLDKTKDGRIEENEFMDWFLKTDFYEKMKWKRQNSGDILTEGNTNGTGSSTNENNSNDLNDSNDDDNNDDDDDDDDNEGIDLSFPQTWGSRAFYIFVFPIMICLYITMFDMQKSKYHKWWPWTFTLSILWLGGMTFFMVWWTEIVAYVWGIPDEILGLTLLAAGTSVPDLFSSVAVAKKGEGDMALSSSIGSNIFDILIGLPLPWLIYALAIGNEDGKAAIPVEAGQLLFSVIILIAMLVAVTIAIKCAGWRLTKYLGYSMFVLYIVFLAQDIIRWRVAEANNN